MKLSVKDRLYLFYLRKIKRMKSALWNAERYRRALGGAEISIGENTHIYTAAGLSIAPGDKITIGKNCVLVGGVKFIAHDASLNLTHNKTIYKPIVVGDNCFFGENSIVLKGVTIGKTSDMVKKYIDNQ